DLRYPQPVQRVRHQLLKPHILDARHTFRSSKVLTGCIASSLPFARVVYKELSHLAQSPSFFSIVDDNTGPTALGRQDALLDSVSQVRPTGADIRTKHVRTVAFIMNSYRQLLIWMSNGIDVAKQ